MIKQKNEVNHLIKLKNLSFTDYFLTILFNDIDKIGHKNADVMAGAIIKVISQLALYNKEMLIVSN